MNTKILKVTKGHFYVYFNLNLRSYGQLVVLVFFTFYDKSIFIHQNSIFFKYLSEKIRHREIRKYEIRFTLHDLFKCVGECPNCGLYTGSNVNYETLYKVSLLPQL